VSPENEWDATVEPFRLLDLLGDRLTPALAWRISIGYCRAQQHRITSARALEALELLESVAVGTVRSSRLATGPFQNVRDQSGGFDLVCEAALRGRQLQYLRHGLPSQALLKEGLRWLDMQTALAHASAIAGSAPTDVVPPDHPWHRTFQRAYYEYVVVKAQVIRCVAGNPFRAPAFDPSWRTSTVLALAEGIHADRAFDRLPILADALEDAGCDNHHVLDHCRRDWSHARGCWVVDLVLGGKEAK
jgi:hypothetical protein